VRYFAIDELYGLRIKNVNDLNSPIDPPTGPLPTQTWRADLALRIRRHLAVKAIGITAFTWLFFVGYFYLLRHPAYPVTVVPLLALDHLIPFQPAALLAYLTLWVYVGFAPGLQLTFLELIVYGLWISALCVTGLAMFYFWPTAVPPLPIDVSAFPGFALLQGVDAAGNACPSMHVAVAIFSAIWLEHLLRQARVPGALRILNAAWFAAIAYSTLAIKQHVALDAAAGALLGVAFALPSLYWRPRKRRAAAAPAATDFIGSHGSRSEIGTGQGSGRSSIADGSAHARRERSIDN
jgi:membrane-associated phospholipid phosphatase